MNQRRETEQFAKSIVGIAPSGANRDRRGMDDIDREAERCGKADRRLNEMRPRKVSASRS